MAQETCQFCGDALVIETEDGWRCIGCGKETDDDDDGVILTAGGVASGQGRD